MNSDETDKQVKSIELFFFSSSSPQLQRTSEFSEMNYNVISWRVFVVGASTKCNMLCLAVLTLFKVEIL